MSTKDKILDASEVLFAKLGFNAVSIRDIVSKANVNIASVNYHFGSKEDLILAVVKRRIEKVNQERTDRLEDLKSKAKGKPIEISELLTAFLQPAFNLSNLDKKNGAQFMTLMGRVVSNSNPKIKAKVFELFNEVVVKFIEEINKALPQIEKEKISLRMYFAIGSMAHTLMSENAPPVFREKLKANPDSNYLMNELKEFIIGGFQC